MKGKGDTMIRKPTSVSIAGYVSLALCAMYFIVLASGEMENRRSIFWATSSDFWLSIFVCAFWWLVGTLIHRSRLNRMRYREQTDAERKT